MSLPRTTLQRIVALALEEDLGGGDVTTAACIDPLARGRAEMKAREPLVFCGVEVVREVFRASRRARSRSTWRAATAAASRPASACSSLRGAAQLAAAGRARGAQLRAAHERRSRRARARTSTRCPQGSRDAHHRHAQDHARPARARALRGALRRRRTTTATTSAAAVLIKDNHIAACGGVARGDRDARARARRTPRASVRGRQPRRARRGARGRRRHDPARQLRRRRRCPRPSRAIARPRARSRSRAASRSSASPSIARAGVDVISVGALTHSAPAVDIGLDWL